MLKISGKIFFCLFITCLSHFSSLGEHTTLPASDSLGKAWYNTQSGSACDPVKEPDLAYKQCWPYDIVAVKKILKIAIQEKHILGYEGTDAGYHFIQLDVDKLIKENSLYHFAVKEEDCEIIGYYTLEKKRKIFGIEDPYRLRRVLLPLNGKCIILL